MLARGSIALAPSTAPSTIAIHDAFETSWLRQLLVFLVTMKIAGIVLIFDPLGFQSFDLPKTLFSHALAWLVGATLLAAVIVHGHGIVPRTRLHLVVAGYVVVSLVSALFAENRYVAVFGDQDRYLGLMFLADMVVLYLAVAVGFRSVKDFAPFLIALAVATSFTFAYAFVQAAGLDPLPWLDPIVQPFRTLDPRAQPFSTLGHPDMLGHFLSIVFAICVLLAFAAPRLGLTTRARAIAALGALLSVGLAAVVGTRGTLLGIGAAIVALAALELRGGVSRFAIAKLWALIVVAGILCLAILAFSPLGARMATVVADQGSGRVALYEAAFRATLARPIFGWGPDNFASAYPAFRQPQPRGGVNAESSAHDWLLQASVTTGVVGVAALIALLATFTSSLWRVVMVRSPLVAAPLLAGLTAYYAQALVSVGSISVDWFPWICFGAIAGITGVSRPTTPRQLGPLIAAPLALLAAAGVVLPSAAFQANRDGGAARGELVAGRVERAISAAEAAVNRDPGRAAYWSLLGLAREKAEGWRDAAAAYEEATLRAPHEASYWNRLALARRHQAEAKDDPQGAGAAAVDAAVRAVAVDPHGVRVIENLADLANEFGEFDVALRAAVNTVVLDDGDPAYGRVAVLAAARVSDLGGARRLLEDAVDLEETPELRLALAVIALRMNDRVAARENAQRALALSPNYKEAADLLAQLSQNP
jgi:tetratricopeptide (TPR) repeat protein